jgi:transcriptional regulator with XRE-family HTH domain
VTAPITPEEAFGAAVRQARERRGWSQETLAAELLRRGLSVGGQSGVARIEQAQRPTRLNEVVLITQFLDLTLDLGGDWAPLPGTPEELKTDRLLTEIRDLLTELVTPVRVEAEPERRIFGPRPEPCGYPLPHPAHDWTKLANDERLVDQAAHCDGVADDVQPNAGSAS